MQDTDADLDIVALDIELNEGLLYKDTTYSDLSVDTESQYVDEDSFELNMPVVDILELQRLSIVNYDDDVEMQFHLSTLCTVWAERTVLMGLRLLGYRLECLGGKYKKQLFISDSEFDDTITLNAILDRIADDSPYIEKISIRDCNLRGIIPESINRLWNLRELSIEGNIAVGGEVPDAVLAMPNLKVLNIRNTSVTVPAYIEEAAWRDLTIYR